MPEQTNVRWYGERGIVNALVTDLAEYGPSGVIELLKCVQWADRQEKFWLDDIEWAEMIVEMKLAHFGDPDLIILCKTRNKEIHAIFVEAKVTPYEVSMARGGSSRINRQLTLKYRFAQALTEWNGSYRPIREPKWCHEAYHRASDSSFVESRTDPRYVAKTQVLDICNHVAMHKVDKNNVYFVAWTWDRTAFFDVDDFERSESRPLFLGADGHEVLSSMRSQLGWLGYGTIDDNERLRNWLTPAYESAFSSMLSHKIPAETALMDTESLPRVNSYNIAKNSCHDIRELMASLSTAAVDLFGDPAVNENPGSTSVTLSNPYLTRKKVLITFFPQDYKSDEHIRLGISTLLNKRSWAGKTFDAEELMGKGNNWQPFFTIRLGNDATDFACAVFAEVSELVGLSVSDGE